jgi:polyisoprenoid-binding protein YceI
MRTVLPALLLLTLSACVEDVGKGKVKADVQDVPAAPAAPETAAAPAAPAAAPAGAALNIDASASSIRALGAKITATHPIDFKDFSGTVTVADDQVVGVDFTVQMAALESDHPKLTAHLKDADFFDVATFPTSTFKAVEIKAGAQAEGDWTHTVVGDFTIHGQTKRITFPAKIEVGADKVSATTEFVIDRKDFGVVYPGRPDDLVQDNVRMNIAFVAPRA